MSKIAGDPEWEGAIVAKSAKELMKKIQTREKKLERSKKFYKRARQSEGLMHVIIRVVAVEMSLLYLLWYVATIISMVKGE